MLGTPAEAEGFKVVSREWCAEPRHLKGEAVGLVGDREHGEWPWEVSLAS